MRVVIVGNGIAGVMTAARLRALEPDPVRLTIEIHTRESFAYYARIRLPEIFATRLEAEDLAIYKPGWYEEKSIGVFKNSEIVRVDAEKRRVFTRDGVGVDYDELVLCMGADSYKPPIRNVDLDGVFTIREYGDADAIRRYITAGTRHAVVVGGGLLGIEAARHLMGPGVEDVTIVEIMHRLLPRQLDETGSRLLRSLVERDRCRVLLGAEVAEFVPAGSVPAESGSVPAGPVPAAGSVRRRPTVRGLRLADGRELPAETVLISAGISPRVGLAREAGCAVRKGVIVDECLHTTVEHIWAAGDLAEFQGTVWGIIPAAMDHAPVVAANILGKGPIVYRQTIPLNTLKVAGVTLTSIGKVSFDPGEEARYQVIEKLDERAVRYEKYVLLAGRLVGCILLGSRQNYAFATQHVGKPASLDEVRLRLW